MFDRTLDAIRWPDKGPLPWWMCGWAIIIINVALWAVPLAIWRGL
jgi:hypothetical protein